MPRKKERRTDQALFTAEMMKRAVEEVLDKKRAIRAVAKDLFFYIFYLYWNITFGHRPFLNVVQFSHITLATYLSNPW